MGFKKHGTGDGRVTETEGASIQREAVQDDASRRAADLARENAMVDGAEGSDSDEG